MKGITAYISSLGVMNIRPAVYGWFFNFLFTIFIYYGFYQVFSIPAGETFLPADGGETVGVFTFLVDIYSHYRGGFPLVFSFAFFFTIGFLLVSVFVSGGVYAVFVDKERPTFTNLTAHSTLNFFAMLKIALLNLMNLIAALIIPLILFMVLIQLTASKFIVIDQLHSSVFFWIWMLITGLCLLYAVVIYDLSRIYKLLEEKSTWRAFLSALRRLKESLWSILAVFLLYGLSLTILYLIYFVLMEGIEEWLFATLIFLVYQLFIMARYYLKVVVIRSEIRLTEI